MIPYRGAFGKKHLTRPYRGDITAYLEKAEPKICSTRCQVAFTGSKDNLQYKMSSGHYRQYI